MTVAAIVGGVLIAPIALPLATFSLYGWEMNRNYKKQQEAELAALIQADQTDSIIGVDENNNGIRDSVEAFMKDKYLDYRTTNALLNRYIRSYQKSIDIKSVPEAERKQIYYDIAMVEECGTSAVEAIEKKYKDNLDDHRRLYTDPILFEYISDQTDINAGFYYVDYFIKNKEQIFLNTEKRKNAKMESDRLVGDQYKVKFFDKGTSLEEKGSKCFAFARGSEYTELAQEDEINSLIGLDDNKNGIRDSVEQYLNKNMTNGNAKYLAEIFVWAYHRSMDIKNVPEAERQQVYYGLAMITQCFEPLLEWQKQNAIRNYDLHYKPQDRGAYQIVQGGLLSLKDHEYVGILQDNAERLFLNTPKRKMVKLASDQFALNRYKPVIPLNDRMNQEEKVKVCMAYSEDRGDKGKPGMK